MAKTLADMTAEERAQCRGMWCDFPDPDERTNLAIYVGDSLKHHGFCELIHEGQPGTLTIPETLTPRFDLPRAWTPDGGPVEMVKEYGIFYTLRDGGEEICFVHDDPLSVEPAVKHLEKSLRRGTITKITRKTQWVTEWEEMPEPQRTNGMVNPYV